MNNLDVNSFKFLNNRQLNEVADIAKRVVRDTSRGATQDNDMWLAQCWLEGLFTMLIKDGYRITLDKNDKRILLQGGLHES